MSDWQWWAQVGAMVGSYWFGRWSMRRDLRRENKLPPA